MEGKFLTVKEFATAADINFQAVYRQLDKRLAPYVQIIDGRKMIDIEALRVFYGVELQDSTNSTDIPPDSTKIPPKSGTDSTKIPPEGGTNSTYIPPESGIDSTTVEQLDSTGIGTETPIQTDAKQPEQPDSATVKALQTALELLKSELDVKNKQIETMQNVIQSQSETIKAQSEAIKSAHALAAGDKQLLLDMQRTMKEKEPEVMETEAAETYQEADPEELKPEEPKQLKKKGVFARFWNSLK